MQLLPADYVLCGLTAALAVLGLFRGVSGTLAFFAGSAAAVMTASLGWPLSAELTPELGYRIVGTVVATLVAFGLVRVIVRKLVNGLLAQPSDALLGCLLGVAVGALILAGWAMSGFHLELSNLATEASGYLKF